MSDEPCKFFTYTVVNMWSMIQILLKFVPSGLNKQWWSLAVAHSHWATWFSSERLGNPKDSLNERIEKNANFGRIEKTALISAHTAFIVP